MRQESQVQPIPNPSLPEAGLQDAAKHLSWDEVGYSATSLTKGSQKNLYLSIDKYFHTVLI